MQPFALYLLTCFYADNFVSVSGTDEVSLSVHPLLYAGRPGILLRKQQIWMTQHAQSDLSAQAELVNLELHICIHKSMNEFMQPRLAGLKRHAVKEGSLPAKQP